MSSHLKLFLGALVLLAVGVGFGIRWMGGAVAQLAFFDPRRHDPYLVFDLVDAGAASANYHAYLSEALSVNGGELVARYRKVALLEGREAQARPDLAILAHAAASDVPRLLTSSDYQARFEVSDREVSGLDENRRTLLGSYETMRGDWPETLVLVLVRSREGALGRAGSRLTEALPRTGKVVWRGDFEALVVSEDWDDMLVMGFDETITALQWLSDDRIKIERRLVRADVDALVIAVYERLPDLEDEADQAAAS